MDITKTFSGRVAALQSQVKQFLSRFAQTGLEALSNVLEPQKLEDLVQQHCPNHRNRIYGPLTTAPCVNMTCNAAITVIREQSSHDHGKTTQGRHGQGREPRRPPR